MTTIVICCGHWGLGACSPGSFLIWTLWNVVSWVIMLVIFFIIYRSFNALIFIFSSNSTIRSIEKITKFAARTIAECCFFFIKTSQETQSIGIHDIQLFSSPQSIIGRFSSTAISWAKRNFVAMFWLIFLARKAKQQWSNCYFNFNLFCDWFCGKFST